MNNNNNQQQQIQHIAVNSNLQLNNGSNKAMGIVGNGSAAAAAAVAANSSGLRQVTHPSHAQMLNAMGLSNAQGPMIPSAAAATAGVKVGGTISGGQGRNNLSVGRQGGLQ